MDVIKTTLSEYQSRKDLAINNVTEDTIHFVLIQLIATCEKPYAFLLKDDNEDVAYDLIIVVSEGLIIHQWIDDDECHIFTNSLSIAESLYDAFYL